MQNLRLYFSCHQIMLVGEAWRSSFTSIYQVSRHQPHEPGVRRPEARAVALGSSFSFWSFLFYL